MDEEVLAWARQAQEWLIQAEDHAEAVRANLRRAVHRLAAGHLALCNEILAEELA